MKKLYFLLLSFLITSISYGQDMVITGVFDGPLSGGIPKVIEIYVVNDIADLSIYGVGSANNGGGTDGEELSFTGSATKGDFIYVASEGPSFLAYFGFNADYIDGSANINGDDAIELFHNGAVIDVFGDINTDGTGEPWEHLDGWAYRNNDTGPDGSTFTLGNWSFSGIDAVDGCTTNAGCGSVYPIGSFTTTLSTKEKQIEDFNLYPNPTSKSFVTIESKNRSTMKVKVFDVLGKQVINDRVSNNRLNVSALTPGVYILRVEQENAFATRKLVIN